MIQPHGLTQAQQPWLATHAPSRLCILGVSNDVSTKEGGNLNNCLLVLNSIPVLCPVCRDLACLGCLPDNAQAQGGCAQQQESATAVPASMACVLTRKQLYGNGCHLQRCMLDCVWLFHAFVCTCTLHSCRCLPLQRAFMKDKWSASSSRPRTHEQRCTTGSHTVCPMPVPSLSSAASKETHTAFACWPLPGAVSAWQPVVEIMR